MLPVSVYQPRPKNGLKRNGVELCQVSTAKNADGKIAPTKKVSGGARVNDAVTCQIVFEPGSEKAPEWVPLFPAPDAEGVIRCRDGRVFTLPNPKSFADRFNAEGRPVPFDYEHASEIRAPQGKPSPAVGWVTKLEARGEEVWARVEWNDEGNRAITSREYRFDSPAFLHNNGEIYALVSAGLTNRPAFTMPAVAHVTGDDSMEKFLEELGLTKDAKPEEIQAAIASLKSKGAEAEAFKAAAEKAASEKAAAEAQVVEKEQQLQAARTKATPALADFVPRADYDASLARVAAIEKQITDGKKAAHQEAVDIAIASALKSGKITPATKDFYVATCASAEGLKSFEAFVKDAPVIAPAEIVTGKPPAASDPVATASALQLKVWDACGIKPEHRGKSLKVDFA